MRRKGKWGEFSKERLKVSYRLNDLISFWQGRGERLPLPRNFPLARSIRANLVKRRVKEKLESGGSRIEITSALSMNQLYYTCDDLV